MWNRRELKARGKAAFKANYWRCVLVALLIAFVLGSGGAAGRSGYEHGKDAAQTETSQTQQPGNALDGLLEGMPPEAREQFEDLPPEVLAQLPSGNSDGLSALAKGLVLSAILGAIAVAMVIFVMIDALLLNPLEVGCRRFFLVNGTEPAQLGEVVFGYENNYWNTVKTILLRDIFLLLWSLLFIIPGIVKSYSYRLVPYILADDPSVTPKAAISISRDLMRGQKWRAFVLDLSFIGWDLLALLTLGILGIFYVSPYQNATDAELYRAIRGAHSTNEA